jgi:3',5'-cyclic AMP phosphodiesterase CpdA
MGQVKFKIVASSNVGSTEMPLFISNAEGALLSLSPSFRHPGSGPSSHLRAFTPKPILNVSESLVGRYVVSGRSVFLVSSVNEKKGVLEASEVWTLFGITNSEKQQLTFDRSMTVVGNDWDTHLKFHGASAQSQMKVFFKEKIVYTKQEKPSCIVM